MIDDIIVQIIPDVYTPPGKAIISVSYADYENLNKLQLTLTRKSDDQRKRNNKGKANSRRTKRKSKNPARKSK